MCPFGLPLLATLGRAKESSRAPPIARCVAGRGSTPASHWVLPPEAAFLFSLAESFCRCRTLCFSAQASQRVWFGIACSRQSLQIPSSLAFSRQSWAAFLEASLYSGGRCLGPSRSLCPSGISSTLGAEAFLGGLGFGSDLGLVLPGFVNRRRSPGFSSTGVDWGLLAGSCLPLNLAGSGTRSRKVAPIFMLGGAGGNRHGRFSGSLSAEESGGCLLNKRTVARPNLPRSFTAFILRACDFLAKSPIFSLNTAFNTVSIRPFQGISSQALSGAEGFRMTNCWQLMVWFYRGKTRRSGFKINQSLWRPHREEEINEPRPRPGRQHGTRMALH